MRYSIIEFNGFPGSGKTTITNILTQSDKIINYDDWIKGYEKYNKSKVFFYLRLFFKFKNLKKLVVFLSILFELKKANKSLFLRFFQILRFIDSYENISEKNSGCIVVDQGVVQEIISIFYSSDIKNIMKVDRLIQEIEKLPILIININVDSTIAKDRMKNRDTNKSRVEFESDKDLYEILKIQNKNFKKIRGQLCKKQTHCLDIDSSVESGINVNKIRKVMNIDKN